MADELTKYYKEYNVQPHAYRMADAKDTSRITILKEWIVKYFKPGARILDIGCGDGYLAKALPQYSWEGIDVAPTCAHAKAHDLMSAPYPFAPASFDGFVCSEVLEHLWDARVVHKEAARLAKPGAIYLVSTPNANHLDHFFTHFKEIIFSEHQTHFFEHIRWYDRETHERLLKDTGFDTIETCGADAHYSKAMQGARHSLIEQGLAITVFEADVILGKCFKDISHTVMLAARKQMS